MPASNVGGMRGDFTESVPTAEGDTAPGADARQRRSEYRDLALSGLLHAIEGRFDLGVGYDRSLH